MRANQPAAAAAEFRVALSADPRNVESLVNLALLQKAAGRVADARDLLRRALAIDPRSAGSHYNLAVVADESGDPTTAIEHYRAFLRYGTVSNADLVGRVRARLTTLGG
jgi:Tfp pilus assembly protein PilF